MKKRGLINIKSGPIYSSCSDSDSASKSEEDELKEISYKGFRIPAY